MHRTEGLNNVNNLFTSGPPATVLEENWLNSVQEEIVNVLVGAGLAPLNSGNDTKDQLWSAIQRVTKPYDIIVSSDTEFANIWERTSANNYSIKTQYNSVYLRFITGGYDMTSILSGGDTYAIFHTNQCKLFVFEPGTYIDMGDNIGYLEINTDDCTAENVGIKGTGSVAAAITKSFYVDANRATLINCWTETRKTNVGYIGFENVNNDTKARSCKYYGCRVDTITGSSAIDGFKYTQNLINCNVETLLNSGASDTIGYNTCIAMDGCIVIDLQNSGAGTLKGYSDCDRITNCLAKTLDTATLGGSGIIYGYLNCDQLANCKATTFDATTNNIIGYDTCSILSNCWAEDFDDTTGTIDCFKSCKELGNCYGYDVLTTTGQITAFNTCDNISSSYAKQFDSTSGIIYPFNSCNMVTGCKIEDIDTGGTIYGYFQCNILTGCLAYDIESTGATSYVGGFGACTVLSGCKADQVDAAGVIVEAFGFTGCDYLSACYATDIDCPGGAHGFSTCEYGSSLYSTEATNSGCDWIDTSDAQITNKYSCPAIWT